MIAPWEVHQLTEEIIDVFTGYSNDLPQYRQAQQQIENTFEKFREKHGYRR